MSKTLIVAEKPDMARKISHALGLNGAMEGRDIVLAASVGHSVEVFAENEDDRTILPFVPAQFKLRVIKGKNDVFGRIEAAMKRPDVTTIVNACDAGREGEAIFRLIYEKAGCRKPCQRAWIKSTTNEGLVEAYRTRKPAANYDGLAAAARCRTESDKLYGYNGSRGAFNPCGRVMTPALGIIVDRYIAHTNFKPEPFWEIHARFEGSGGAWSARWTRDAVLKEAAGEEKAKAAKDDDEDAEEAEGGSRFKTRSDAEKIVAACRGRNPVATQETSKIVRSRPPLLFSLSALQIEASARLGLSSEATLEGAQRLYEAGLTTYPRTSSRYLTQDYGPTAQKTLAALARGVAAYAPHVAQARIETKNKAVFDDSKVTDHFAIVPTGEGVADVGRDQALYDMICRRFIAVFMPHAEYFAVQRLSTILGGDGVKHHFYASARRLKTAGWTAVERSGAAGAELPALKPGEHGVTKEIKLHEGVTKPPPLLTEGSLIRLMVTAGKMVEDEELAAAMADAGIGTEATRANIIKKLLASPPSAPGAPKREPYVKTERKKLVPTARGLAHIAYVRSVFSTLTSPEMTGQWEKRLALIERGQDTREKFMADARAEVTAMAEKMKASPPARGGGSGAARGAANAAAASAQRAAPTPGLACPCCRKPTKDFGQRIACECGFTLWRTQCGVTLDDAQVAAVMAGGKTAFVKGFVSPKTGKSFDAHIAFDKAKKGSTFEFPPRK